MNYDVVIGIETHIQLNTQTKMFCRCSAQVWQTVPNTHVCPACLGLPGALPVMNKNALDKAILLGLALHSTVAQHSKFDRKNYFYPDLAKGYQISQYDEPINVGGYVEVDGAKIGLIRAHLEEDVGKLTHAQSGTLVDFNKGGIPLMEIVSEPVIRSSAEAKSYVQALRQLVRYLGINDGNMERGSIRADINISLQKPGQWRYLDGRFETNGSYQLSQRAEIKNVNSFRNIERAIDHEIQRQSIILDQGGHIEQETRGWDEVKGITTSQRTKEDAQDYRYFPEPDLPPLVIDHLWVEQIRQILPELPYPKTQRFIEEYQLAPSEARLLTMERQNADWFETAVAALRKNSGQSVQVPKLVANWMLGELAKLQNDNQCLISESQLRPDQLAQILLLVEQGQLTTANAKEVVGEVFVHGSDPGSIILERGLIQVSNADDLLPVAQRVVDANADAVANLKAGKASAMQFLVGQVMKETKGRANPGSVKEILDKILN
jgi:aspartyl-tRNA(Asn)/glutamyl-tRNA(Gln) amidotransferase subunit B